MKKLLLSLLCAFFAVNLFCEAEQRVLTVIDYPHVYDLNPHTACYSSEAQVLTGLYEGLFAYNYKTLDPEPALCESYTISRNKKRWTFVLKENCTFSDGEKITAQTFYDSWTQLLANPAAAFASMLDCINGAAEFREGKIDVSELGLEVKDEKTLVVRLKEPAEHLPRILCHHAFAAVSKNENVFSGPYVLTSNKDGALSMVKNEKYHDAENVKIPGYVFVQSDDVAENAFKFNTGYADWVTGSIDSAKVLNPSSIHIAAEFGTHYFFFSGKNKPWDNPQIRMALLEAIPWTSLRKGYLVQASTLVYPLTGYPKVTGLSECEPDEALEMMKSARKELGIPLDEELSLVFAVTSDEIMKDQAEVLKEAWKPLGVNLTVQVTPTDRYIASIPGWNADLFYYSWIGDFADPLAFLELFRGNSSLNVSKYCNPKYDQLLSDAANADDAETHYKYLSQAEQILLDDGEIIPISHPISLHVIDLDLIGGWSTNALDIHPLKTLYFKEKNLSLPNLVRK